ncbi:MAG: hypothetical protein IIX84_01885, partial [Oscillospiraceae bacterium]|nr:hypothetical protein [Oscillospiraceae bacterium]
KGGIKLDYGKLFKLYTTVAGEFVTVTPSFEPNNHFADEIAAFVECCQTREKIRSNIDYVLPTTRLMDALYASADAGREVEIK